MPDNIPLELMALMQGVAQAGSAGAGVTLAGTGSGTL